MQERRNEVEACLRQQKKKNELDKSSRNVRESHIHEERAIINWKEEESQERAERSAFIKKRKGEENKIERAAKRKREREVCIYKLFTKMDIPG